MRSLIAILLALSAGLLALPLASLAQESWADSRPVYESDVRQKVDHEEAQRAERRKSFPPVVYPTFMNGGDRPDIKPAEPPIVYFGKNEEVGSIIVDTQRRTLYFILPGKRAY